MTSLEIKKSFINKASSVLFGVFISSLLLSFFLNQFGKVGIYLGLGTNTLITVGGFYYCKNKSYARYVTYGILATLIIAILLYIVGMSMLEGAYEGF